MSEPLREVADGPRLDILKIFSDYRKWLLRITLAATVVVALVGGVYLQWLQPTRWVSWLEFTPTFENARNLAYPNQLPFGPGDITDASVMDQVYDRNDVKSYCAREAFRNSFFIERRGPEWSILETDYVARLSDARLTPVERDRIAEEFRAKQDSLPLEYRLTFVRNDACSGLPTTIVSKALTEVLEIWAKDAETKRGVLNRRVSLLSPAVFRGVESESSRLRKSDLLRTNLKRVLRDIGGIERVPGWETIKIQDGDQRVGLSEIRAGIEDLLEARLEPLAAVAAIGPSRADASWAEGALALEVRVQQEAQSRTSAIKEALRDYSGLRTGVAPPPVGTPGSGDVQTITPQIDRTFIDRIIEMAAANIAFRQELTRLQVRESNIASERESNVSYYRQLLKPTGSQPLSPAEIDVQLGQVIAKAKELTAVLNRWMEEMSRVSLRSAASLYRTESAIAVSIARPFSLRMYVNLVAATFMLSLMLAFLTALVHSRTRAGVVQR